VARLEGQRITPNQRARLLEPFGVASDSIRIGDKPPKGYYRHQFQEVWQSYLARADPCCTKRSNATKSIKWTLLRRFKAAEEPLQRLSSSTRVGQAQRFGKDLALTATLPLLCL
jgi:hypothetical protein